MASTSSAKLNCLCGSISEPGTLLSDSVFPLSLEICHCNPCRQTTGSLGAVFPALNSSPSKDTLSKLTAYYSSGIITRYFCSTCGCSCFVYNQKRNEWFSLGGIIELSPSFEGNNATRPKDIVKISRHDFVLDTVDGGLVPILLSLNGRSIPTWSAAAGLDHESDSFDLSHASVLSLPKKSIGEVPPPGEDSYLTAKCHCEGVSLLIKRANYPSNPGDEVPRQAPTDPTKYPAYFCACRSCRLSSGVSMVPYALIPTTSIFNANAPALIDDSSSSSEQKVKPLTYGHASSDSNSNPGLTLKHHWSSQDTCRSFCGKCGATVSYWCNKRPDGLDLAVGILRSEEGSMARRWLQWEWGQCSFQEECIDRELCDAWLGSKSVMEKIDS
ncbi:hypothetical protein F5882DRAFT_482569 [Hyaloscypha sp. PMI_1271]|nr:hypothetical protein F5882DRAFT_482569 [Hyaloscypha sp. PMI_1271]